MLSVWSRFVGLAVLCLAASTVLAQNATITPKVNSPFSRYGIGDLVDQFYAAPGGMGGPSAAFNDPYHLNILNPASLAQLEATAFELGIFAQYSKLKSDEAAEDIWSGNLNYMALGFPLINPINKVLDRRRSPWKAGMAFALQPYSIVGYNIESTQVKEGLGPTTNFLKGTGGTYRLSWNNGVAYKGFSAGFTFGYLFGQLTNSRRVEFDSVELAFTTEFLDEVSINGFYWRGGLQYTHTFKETNAKGETAPSGRRLTVGVHGNSPDNFNTNTTRFAERYNFSFNTRDTIFNESEVKQSGTLPSEFTAGLMYEQRNEWRLGLEYGIQNWSEYVNEAKPDSSLSDTWRIQLGGEWTPNHLSYNNYFERVRYRLGFFYGLDPRSFEGEQLQEYGISAGFGFPIILSRQRTSFVNLALEAGRFGQAGILRENYFRMTLGFTLNDNTWFFKRKFN